MKLSPMLVYGNKVTGKDALGNPIKESVLLTVTRGVIMPWTLEEIALKDRNAVKAERKLITEATRELMEQSSTVSIDGSTYTVELPLRDSGRWRVCTIKEM